LGQTAQEAVLGNWAVTWTQLKQRGWEERQHILRIKGKGPFKLLLIPYRTGQERVNLTIAHVRGKFILSLNGRRYEL